jgi:glycerol-3-phosphate dehydrogenase (NAD(P)+)
MNQKTISIIGAGAWGTALAVLWANAGRRVRLVARTAEQASMMTHQRQNAVYLPGITLPENLAITSVIDSADLWVIATPAQAMRAICEQLPKTKTPLLLCSKGIERDTGMLMSDIAAQYFPQSKLAILSGPNFAGEVARGLPTASVIASQDTELKLAMLEWLSTPNFRLYHSDDVVGAEIAGALKNVLAIACGIAQGMGLGENARAALITRGLAEIKRLSLARGAKAETLAGLSGLGDLVLSCSSPTSRNMSFGLALGQGMGAETALNQRRSVVEGVPTASAVLHLAKQCDVEMPICNAVHAVISGRITARQAVQILLDRPLKQE